MTKKYHFNWEPYTGEYEKLFYDIRLYDGREYSNCYPNAGKFFPFDESEDFECVPEDLVREFKVRDTECNRYSIKLYRNWDKEDSSG